MKKRKIYWIMHPLKFYMPSKWKEGLAVEISVVSKWEEKKILKYHIFTWIQHSVESPTIKPETNEHDMAVVPQGQPL